MNASCRDQWLRDLGSSPLGLQERALGGVGGELDRSVVGLDGRHLVAGAGQEVGSGGVVGLVVGEGGAVGRLQHFQSDLGARSEEGRGGKEGVRTVRFGWWAYD